MQAVVHNEKHTHSQHTHLSIISAANFNYADSEIIHL